MKKNISLTVIFITFLSSVMSAQEPVYFADPNLKAVVEETLGVTNPTRADMLGLDILDAFNRGITNLAGLEYATNMRILYIRDNQVSDLSPLSDLNNLRKVFLYQNQISDISPLAGLTELESLDLFDNQISDITPLSGLRKLYTLKLRKNQISDISPLSGLTNLIMLNLHENRIRDLSPLFDLIHLTNLYLYQNQISDISPLAGLINLKSLEISSNQVVDVSPLSELMCLEGLYLQNNQISDISALSSLINLQNLNISRNPLNADAYNIYIPLIQSYGTDICYDSPGSLWYSLTTDSTVGGSVAEPGEGSFYYENITVVDISAVAENGYKFVSWTGTAVSAGKIADPASANITVTIDGDYTIRANFEEIQFTFIYVDDNAFNDPVPNDPQVSDPSEDGSAEHPYDTIQEAIDAAVRGDTVLVYPGTYQEEIIFQGKALTVQGIATSDGIPVLENPGDFAVSFYNDEGLDSALKNFIIRNNFMAVFIAGSSPTISNITVVDNTYGIEAYASSEPDISNSIFWNNTNDDLFQCEARYSCIERAVPGEGNIDSDPLFVDPNNGDYHLRSERGRYWPEYDVWVLDKVTSPCIDGGDPTVNPLDEPRPNGNEINMGAYGGTAYASMKESPVVGVTGEVLPQEIVDQVWGITGGFWNSDSPWFIAMFQNRSDYTITKIAIRIRLTDRDTNEQQWYGVVLGPPGAVIPPGETMVLTGNVGVARGDKDFYWVIAEMRGYRD